jgi:hypothetical protein
MPIQQELALTCDEEAEVKSTSPDPAFLRLYLEKRYSGRLHREAIAAAKSKFFAAWC